MRSRVVPMRDMKEKFGAEVESFRYAFVIPRRVPGWDQPAPEPPAVPVPPLLPSLASGTPAGTPAGEKPRKYIEVKPRGD